MTGSIQRANEHPAGKTDKDANLATLLNEFRKKVQRGRLVKYWTTAAELPGIVALSLTAAIKRYPAIGWVRGNSTASSELLEEINELRKKNDDLQTALRSAAEKTKPNLDNLAGLDFNYRIGGTFQVTFADPRQAWVSEMSFGQLFSLIAPILYRQPNDDLVKSSLIKLILASQNKNPFFSDIDEQAYQTLKIQFQALGLVEITYELATDKKYALFWTITEKGTRTMMEVRVIRQKNDEQGTGQIQKL